MPFNQAMLMAARLLFYPYEVPYSCRFNGSNAYMDLTFGGSTDDQRMWSLSLWFRRSAVTDGNTEGILSSYADGSNWAGLFIYPSADYLMFYSVVSGTDYSREWSQVNLRDLTGWYHILLVADFAQAAADDRMVLYLNGVEVSSYTSTYGVIPQNYDQYINYASAHHYIGIRPDSANYLFEGYFSEFRFLDGIAAAPTDFGQFKSGVWVPRRYTGSYGTAGFAFNFADSGDLGNDVSGNGNDWTTYNMDSDDQTEDTPTNTYPIYSSLHPLTGVSSITDGGLLVTTPTAATARAFPTMPIPITGSWYMEYKCINAGALFLSGLANYDTSKYDAYYGNDGNHYDESGNEAYGDSFAINDWVGIHYDADSEELTFYKNGASQGAIDVSGRYTENEPAYFYLSDGSSLNGAIHQCNFGQLPWEYDPPAGAKALCTANLADPTLIDCSEAFDIVTRTGTGAVASVTGVGHDCSSDELVWIKNRDQADEHKLVDTERGATKELSSDSANSEQTDANGLTSFDSGGISLGTGANGYNDNGEDFVLYFFNILAMYGMDIVEYVGTGVARTVSHNLGVVPELIIVKSRDSGTSWNVYHYGSNASPEEYYAFLDTTDAFTNAQDRWNDTAPTSSVFSLGTPDAVNKNGDNFIAYLFASIPGIIKVGYYTGNGNSNGPFVYCGFRPKWVLWKAVPSSSWVILDSERTLYNPIDDALYPDSGGSEATGLYYTDFLSNGFKIRNANGAQNYNSGTVLYLAIADQPFKYANAF